MPFAQYVDANAIAGCIEARANRRNDLHDRRVRAGEIESIAKGS